MSQVNHQAVALNLAVQLHPELLADEGMAGYDGSKEQFDALHAELEAIARTEVSEDVPDYEGQILDTFWEFFGEICEGERDVDWYLWV